MILSIKVYLFDTKPCCIHMRVVRFYLFFSNYCTKLLSQKLVFLHPKPNESDKPIDRFSK